jgi:hypothetical protein
MKLAITISSTLLVFCPFVLLAEESHALAEPYFSSDPQDCLISVQMSNGEASGRKIYKLYGDGRVQVERFNGSRQLTPSQTWSAYLDAADLASITREILDSRLFEFTKVKQSEKIRASARSPSVILDAGGAAVEITLNWATTERPREATYKLAIDGGLASEFEDIPEFGVAQHLFRLLTHLKQPKLDEAPR